MKSLLILAILFFANQAAAKADSFPKIGAHFSRVIEIVFENENASSVNAQADFAALAKMGLSFTNFSAESHPSQPNYIAMIAGDTLGVLSDGSVNLKNSHLGDLLEKKNLDWRVYAESFPGNCFNGDSSGTYYRKHNPFISFLNISQNANRCQKIVNANEFQRDLANNTLPAYSLYVPDINNDGHNTGVDFAGKWLMSKFGTLLSNPQFLADTLVIITFDESESLFGANRVYTVLLGAALKDGTNAQAVNHVSLLKLIEDEYQLGSLSTKDQSAASIQGIWK